MPYSFDNVCLACQLQYKTEKMGVTVIEMASFGPYKIWMADLKKCPGCGHEIVGNFAEHQLCEHFEQGFDEILKKSMEHGSYLLIEYKGDKVEQS